MNLANPVIFMEGPDGTGKSILGKGLACKFHIPYFKVQREKEFWAKNQFMTALRFDQTYLVELLEQTHIGLVCDRGWPSEWVYSRVFQRETDHELLKKLEARYKRRNAWIVVTLRRDYETARKDELVSPDKLRELDAAYQDFIRNTSCKTVTVYADDFLGEEGIDKEIEETWKAMCEHHGGPAHLIVSAQK